MAQLNQPLDILARLLLHTAHHTKFLLTFLLWEGVGYDNLSLKTLAVTARTVLFMRLFVRYLLWLLIAALPLQGMAAAAMACHDDLRQAGAASHQMADAHADTATAGHCGGEHQHHSSGAHGKCSQCASCCIGAAAPPAMETAVPPAIPPTTVIAASEPAMIVYVPAALERPPRQHA